MGSSERVLLIGSGGREHAIALKLLSSNHVEKIYVAPGNAGTKCMNQDKVFNVDISIKNNDEIVEWSKQNNITFVIIGPEDPLANGINNDLFKNGIPCFGPSKAAAQIESSKEFAKQLMTKHDIPTARWKSFVNSDEACSHIEKASYKAYVIKENGLAAGKGVTIANSVIEAQDVVRSLFTSKSKQEDFKIVIEEILEGEEVSVLCFSDGKDIKMMLPTQDYKRLNDNDVGPNTGGMGAYCPCSWVSDEDLCIIKEEILEKTICSLKNDGIEYKGILYAGLMLTSSGPKVLEFNCRFGDPETQVILSLLKSDLFELMKSCVDGSLATKYVIWDDKFAAAVILVSSGYPGSYAKNKLIKGCENYKTNNRVHIVHAGTAINSQNEIVTNGGRVLAVVAKCDSLEETINEANQAAAFIDFDGKFYRSDIGKKGLNRFGEPGGMTYASSGVNITAGNELISEIKSLTDSTKVAGVMGSIGSFGGLFNLKESNFDGNDTILVSGTDGVGTKLLIAQHCDLHDKIGIDLVAMCANDVLSHGAQPLFFLDYFACGKLDLHVVKSVIQGISDGCRQAKCALLGGETAEMPGMYPNKKYDLAGFCVGAVKKSDLLPRMNEVKEGDVVIGIASSGIHSNGFSLVRSIIEKAGLTYDDAVDGKKLKDFVLEPTKIYVHLLNIILKSKAFIHITGGGLLENIPRVLPKHFGVVLDSDCWVMPKIFSWLAEKGNVKPKEMLRTFNCGIGGAIIVDGDDDIDRYIAEIEASGEKAFNIGKVRKIDSIQSVVEVKNIENKFTYSTLEASSHKAKRKRVAVLISGSGTNLQALIDSSKKIGSCYEIVLVISNVDCVYGLQRATDANIKTKVISHKGYKSRDEFDSVIHDCLKKHEIEYVCLAGFMRILSESFVSKWRGRMLNTHPSLLPSFRGIHAVKQALDAGVSITGCTVHFVSEELDAGSIVTQEAVNVSVGDNVNSLQDRIKLSEHIAYPRALQLLTSGAISLGQDNKIVWK